MINLQEYNEALKIVKEFEAPIMRVANHVLENYYHTNAINVRLDISEKDIIVRYLETYGDEVGDWESYVLPWSAMEDSGEAFIQQLRDELNKRVLEAEHLREKDEKERKEWRAKVQLQELKKEFPQWF